MPEYKVKTALQFFNEDQRKSGKTGKWLELSPADQNNYQKQAEAARKAYEKQLKEFCDKNGLTVE